ncbi:hypothetical protein GLAREA_01852 [Glarea lozoyensis ATCC 20868]|uniref:Uncharacterized protein n=1 Tax=Glarea lozoyensis (strain ATCC 20868 / MF5171) TaxID=1116229 RepID=S3CJG7_GLAL2|nr:uncharacterized protein GLAREA_01852 [Glarea lozoyensis ATCC 20868]EPE25940.1 hypothetical protein GLAREA_01852 [Glarea lozoyensis ATCC 20868]
MSHNPSELPPYSEKHDSEEKSTPTSIQTTTNRIAGTINTCSVKDGQVDYFTVVRDSPTSYHVSLTIDPTPIYRIELVSDSTKLGDIQVFPANDPNLPAIAAARLSTNPKKSKTEPAATTCVSSPHDPNSTWWPLTRSSTVLLTGIVSPIPIITVPGRAAITHNFSWEISSEPIYRLWWCGQLPFVPKSGFVHVPRGPEYQFAAMTRKSAAGGENILEIRRGGGLDFELTVLLHFFVLVHMEKGQLL